MNFLLCYRATDGTPVYSEPVTGEGAATLRLDKTPSSTNGSQMVFAVVVNTDYKYSGNEDIRTKHFDYKLKIDDGISGAGDANVKYYNDFKLDYKWPEIGANYSSSSQAPESSSSEQSTSSSSSAVNGTVVLMDGLKGPATHMNLSYRQGKLNVQYNLTKNDNVKISLFSGFGALIAQEITGLQDAGMHTYSFELNRMPRGVYVVKVSTDAYREAWPITILR